VRCHHRRRSSSTPAAIRQLQMWVRVLLQLQLQRGVCLVQQKGHALLMLVLYLLLLSALNVLIQELCVLLLLLVKQVSIASMAARRLSIQGYLM
jgi:hypothetical protein